MKSTMKLESQLIHEIECLIVAGVTQESEAPLEEARFWLGQAEPTDPYTDYLYGLAWGYGYRYPEARDAFARAVAKTNGECPLYSYNYAMALGICDARQQARELVAAARERFPDHLSTLLGVYNLALLDGDPRAALSWVKQLIRERAGLPRPFTDDLFPSTPRQQLSLLHVFRGALLYAWGEYDQAVAAGCEAAALYFHAPEPYRLRDLPVPFIEIMRLVPCSHGVYLAFLLMARTADARHGDWRRAVAAFTDPPWSKLLPPEERHEYWADRLDGDPIDLDAQLAVHDRWQARAAALGLIDPQQPADRPRPDPDAGDIWRMFALAVVRLRSVRYVDYKTLSGPVPA